MNALLSFRMVDESEMESSIVHEMFGVKYTIIIVRNLWKHFELALILYPQHFNQGSPMRVQYPKPEYNQYTCSLYYPLQ